MHIVTNRFPRLHLTMPTAHGGDYSQKLAKRKRQRYAFSLGSAYNAYACVRSNGIRIRNKTRSGHCKKATKIQVISDGYLDDCSFAIFTCHIYVCNAKHYLYPFKVHPVVKRSPPLRCARITCIHIRLRRVILSPCCARSALFVQPITRLHGCLNHR